MQEDVESFAKPEGAVLLAASVPRLDARSTPEQENEAGRIRSAIMALAHAVLGHRRLVWGGHPTVTPIVALVAQAQGIDFQRWTCLYQSRHFASHLVRENRHFGNVAYTPDLGSLDSSIARMRAQMIADHRFEAAVFIGGGPGVRAEHDLLVGLQPEVRIIPVASTGRTARALFEAGDYPQRLATDTSYGALFRDLLIGADDGIS